MAVALVIALKSEKYQTMTDISTAFKNEQMGMYTHFVSYINTFKNLIYNTKGKTWMTVKYALVHVRPCCWLRAAWWTSVILLC